MILQIIHSIESDYPKTYLIKEFHRQSMRYDSRCNESSQGAGQLSS